MGDDFRIGSWLVQPSLNTVSQSGKTFHIEPKMMEVLVCLARHAGETLSKETLLEAVWPDTFVTDDVLTRCIFELRRVFGDGAKESRFIQTISRRGYRLVAPIEKGAGTAVSAGWEHGDSKPAPLKGKAWRKTWTRVVVVAGGVVAILAGFNVGGLRGRFLNRTTSTKIRSLAVLPLTNLSNDSAQDYFAEGMTDALITDLSQISALRVVSRTTIMGYKKTDKPAPQIAQELHVDGIVEGTVQRSGNRVRITAQLIYAPGDTSVWARTYDRDLRDVLAVQSTTAKEIADEIRVNMTPSETVRLTKPRTVNLEALQAYWKGQYYLSSLTRNMGLANEQERLSQEERFRQAIAYFEEAIRRDPNYSPAYLGYYNSVHFFQDSVMLSPAPATILDKGRTALMKALALDDTLPKAHLALGNLFFYSDWNWVGAEGEYKRALELDANSAEVHCSYADYLDSMGRFDEGLKEQEMQLQLNPDLDCELQSPLIPLESRIERERKFIETHNATEERYWNLGLLLWKASRYKEATDVWQDLEIRLGYLESAEAIGRGFAKNGYPGALREWAKACEARAKQRYVPRVLMAYIYGVLGNNDRALVWLEKAYAEHESSLQSVKVFIAWDPLRSDPRFQDLLRRMNFPP